MAPLLRVDARHGARACGGGSQCACFFFLSHSRPLPPHSTDTPPAPPAGKPRERGVKKGASPAPSTSSEAEVRALRAAKAEEVRASGGNPYAFSFPRTHTAAALAAEHVDLPAGETADLSGASVAVAGRVLARRVMGKLAFIRLADASGDVQLYIDRAILDGSAGEGAFARVKALVDVGDIVGASGGVKRTDKGELSVVAESVSILTKALRPLPDKWHGLADVEKRYRQRYVDMIVTPGVRETLAARATMMRALRSSLDDRGFIEVETPILEAAAGGADARPFVTYHNALGQPFALRIATELHLKRCVVGGFERVYEIGRIFRNEGVSTRHNPEFTSVELYQAYADVHDMMELTEALIRDAAVAVTGGAQISYQGAPIDLGAPFARASMAALVAGATGVDFEGDDLSRAATDADREAAATALRSAGAARGAISATATAPCVGTLLATLFEELVEPTLMQPTFVLDHPASVSPLAKPHRSVPGAAERFELYIAGRELANAYTEATDPIDQRAKLEAQIVKHRAAQAAAAAGGADNNSDDEDYDVSLDEDFLTALEHGLPPTGGMGMGLDRLAMLLTDKASIRDVLAFPLLKRKPVKEREEEEKEG